MATTGVSIAVMPFRNLSPEPDTDLFADRFVEDLTADLTRFSSLRVLAAESAFALGQSKGSVDDVAEQWDLDSLLTGSLRRGEANLRVGVQLMRVEGRETVWAERFDAPLKKVFDIQVEIEKNAFDYASQAVRLDDRDALVHSVLARIYRVRHQHRQADQHADRALALNSNDALNLTGLPVGTAPVR